MAQKVSCLSAAHGKETSDGDGSLPLRQVRLEGLGLLRDRQSNSNLWSYGEKTRSGHFPEEEIIALRTLTINQAR